MIDVSFQVGDRIIGPGHPCFIIAEVGSNHDQDLEQAKALIDVAAEAKVDAVKFQAFMADLIAAKTSHPLAQIDFAGCSTLHELYKQGELPREWLGELKEYAESLNLIFLCTPFDEEASDILDDLGTLAYKVASFEMTHHPLLQHLAAKGKPLLISTGMATLGEIEEAMDAVRAVQDVPVGLFHCGSQYPLGFESANLRAIGTMQQALRVPVGYSDHTIGLPVPIAAVARGASMIEKHYTLDRNLPGPDHGFALEPNELKDMVQGIREVEAALGNDHKGPAEEEMEHRKRGRRGIFASVDISKGTRLEKRMLAVLRPGAGLEPKYRDMVIGREAKRDIQAYEPITWDVI